jgi:hypothetical protein
MLAICCSMLFSDMIDVSARRSQHEVMERRSDEDLKLQMYRRGRADAMRRASISTVGRAPARKRSATAADGATQEDELTVLQSRRNRCSSGMMKNLS